ncbi:putative ATP-dependent DNA ligase [Ilumatobacter coccineus YM16-304]|uniref:Putative ATP-dependent DNA ligase n=1 Tax=Ilumatobacter coccineus (strain NBRC 103263 / KCTC 29153 / YM16-304) TaxID=1313172 RepID=A0A6C7E657_ILUCY|nr:putative ATP-dependent DNA ligase [Ilumatobacter coccineus YM16-304]
MEEARRFVIQQHDATRLHWDLRLEHEGVLLSWALPRGVPWNPKENRLAVQTEDHSLDFLDREGDDFDGRFGAGRSTQWDTGTYELHKIEPSKDDPTGAPVKLVVTLHGRRVSGKYSLFSMRGSRDWLIHRMDPPDDEHRKPVPIGVRPMIATPGEMPVDSPSDWSYETRWNGIRAIVTDDTGRVLITGADAADISIHFPEIRRIGRALGHREVILDGMIVPVDPTTGTVLHDRAGLTRRLNITSDSGARNAAKTAPVVFMAFDILWIEGRPITDLPWELRRRQLDDLRLDGPGWRTSPSLSVDEAYGAIDAETGIVAKRRDSVYTIDRPTPDWIDTA